MHLKKTLAPLLFALLLVHQVCLAQVSPAYQIKAKNYVLAKNYYLLNLLQLSPQVKSLLTSDTSLVKIAADKVEAIKASLNCKDATCFTRQLKFTDEEIKQVGNLLAKLYKPNNALGSLVKNDLIPSGAYILNKSLSPQQQLVKAWEQDAEGINYAISIYAEGKKPRYADIDSISFNVNAKSYPGVLEDAANVALSECKNTKVFFDAVLTYALQAMEINGRHDAANFEPLAAGLNKAALQHIKQTNWGKYKYSSILILGSGPGDLLTDISPIGMLRCRMGAVRYFAGLAPFIIVSGGMAHPYKTKYCEAIEMKKFLVENLHVPANAVIVETQARHTTTNVRNGIRLIYRYGMPFNKAFVTVSSKSHIEATATSMAERCVKELKYVPYKVGKRIDDNALELYPLTDALQINPLEPLDPR